MPSKPQKQGTIVLTTLPYSINGNSSSNFLVVLHSVQCFHSRRRLASLPTIFGQACLRVFFVEHQRRQHFLSPLQHFCSFLEKDERCSLEPLRGYITPSNRSCRHKAQWVTIRVAFLSFKWCERTNVYALLFKIHLSLKVHFREISMHLKERKILSTILGQNQKRRELPSRQRTHGKAVKLIRGGNRQQYIFFQMKTKTNVPLFFQPLG